MQNTNIQWTDHTENFWWGCTKVSRACKHCYAETVAKVFGKRLFGSVPQWGAGKPRFERLEKARAEALAIQKRAKRDQDGFAENAEEARKHGAFIDVPPPRRPRVFVNSMSDWLDDEVPLEWLAFLLETLAMCPNVDFQLLTKRPENWAKRVNLVSGMYDLQTEAGKKAWGFGAKWYIGREAPQNLWIGTTVEDQAAADARIPHLLQIPARVRFLSCEPLVGLIELAPEWIGSPAERDAAGKDAGGGDYWVNWLIAGGESGGPAEPMHPDWLRSLRDQCAAAGVPFFFKQWGEWLPQTQAAALPAPARAYKGHKFPDDTLMLRVGVKDAGAVLDGVEHLAFPQSFPSNPR